MLERVYFPSVRLWILHDQKKYVLRCIQGLFLSVIAIFLAACQSTTPSNTILGKNVEQPLKLRSVQDGVQNLHWKITEIGDQQARFFNQTPYLRLNPTMMQVQGSTGCNVLSGHYQLNMQEHRLNFDVKAGYQSCDRALAQEAELLAVLAQTKRYQLLGNRIQLLDQQGRVLLTAQK